MATLHDEKVKQISHDTGKGEKAMNETPDSYNIHDSIQISNKIVKWNKRGQFVFYI